MNTVTVQEQKQNVRHSRLLSNDKTTGSDSLETPTSNILALQDRDYSDNVIILGNPIELIKRISEGQSSAFMTNGYKVNMEKKVSLFSRLKAFFRV
ncbi:hypothetical protein [uncultured Methanomethylovorans sp.]|uniref:hypothetical protein n=1 Tax=uncultured Methanomethylovorans sp. TaxID=183759 RepID=UPI002AA80D4D|nr:hypothetical protein [uncultured Methanomethylovorans sp.]